MAVQYYCDMTLWDTVDKGRPLQLRVVFALQAGFALASYTAIALWTLTVIAGSRYNAFESAFDVFDMSASAALSIANSMGLIAAAIVSVLLLVFAVAVGIGIEQPLLLQLGAYAPKRSEYASVRDQLHTMSLAAGLQPVPALYVVDDAGVNAALFRSEGRLVVVATRGLLANTDLAIQQAIFASLLGRHAFSRLPGLYTLAVLVNPVWAFVKKASLYVSRLFRGDETERAKVIFAMVLVATLGVLFPAFAVGILAEFALFWLAVWVVTEYSYRAHVALAHHGDAEGMMLLKDPAMMVRAIRETVQHDNEVLRAHGAGMLFFCWPEERYGYLRDPEADRVDRLKRLLGVEGHFA